MKLAPRFNHPFKVLERVGQVAYRLELLVATRIHSIFHVSCLKRKMGNTVTIQTQLLEID